VVGELGLNIRYACNNLLRLLYKWNLPF
jgi:hypothetical protein